MQKLLLLAVSDNDRTEYFSAAVNGKYEIERADSLECAKKAVRERLSEFTAVIADNPSGIPGMEELISELTELNSYMMAAPMLMLTDSSNREKDEAFLSDTVTGLIEKGESAPSVLHRIAKSVDVVNSSTFQEFSDMLKLLPSLIYLKDNKGRYVFCSQYWHHLEHYNDPDWTIRGKTDMDIRKNQENARLAYESDLRIIESGKGTSYIIEENEDDSQEFLQLIKEPIKDENGNVRGIIAIINNVTEQELLRRELRKKSITDELTGLYNRTYFDEYYSSLGEDDYPLSVISADCDGLKAINDLYGHIAGDEYIRMTAAVLKEKLPKEAAVFRTGGDEFVALVPRTGKEAAAEILDNLIDHEKMFSVMGRALSVSFGTSTADDPDVRLRVTIEEADREMYRQKREKAAARGGSYPDSDPVK